MSARFGVCVQFVCIAEVIKLRRPRLLLSNHELFMYFQLFRLMKKLMYATVVSHCLYSKKSWTFMAQVIGCLVNGLSPSFPCHLDAL